MAEEAPEEREVEGQKLLSAVERLLAETGSLVALSNECIRKAKARKLGDEERTIAAAAREVVGHYSNLSAISGGATALPGLLPGLGSLVTITGGALADVALLLKFEVEMALVLTHLHGFDITHEDERRRAFLMASVNTYGARHGRNFFVDLAEAESQALWSYGPREASKLLLLVLSKLALASVGKGLVRALPVVGIAVGASLNKVLTRRVGERCTAELVRRRLEPSETMNGDEVVDARVAK